MSAVGGMVGGLVDTFAGGGDDERKKQDEALKSARGRWSYGTDAAGQSGTEFDKIDPSSRDAMTRAMASYQGKVDAGGLDAIGRANLEGAKAEAAQTAATSAHQVQNEALRRGAGGGKAAVLQTIAGQQAGEGARQGAFQSAAMAEMARDNALKGVTGTAGAIYGMDANRAAAQDAINQFNVKNAQQNIQNKAIQGQGGTKADLAEADVEGQRAEAAKHKFSNIGSAIGGAAASFIPGGAAVEGATQLAKGIGGMFKGSGMNESQASWAKEDGGSYG